MPVTINGTTGITGPDGSASTPSLAGADTNTGVFFPAADTVAIATGGTERVRVSSTGEVTRYNTDPGGVTLKRTDGVNSNGWLNFVGSDDVVDGSVRMATDVANALTFLTAATEQARITSAGLFQFNSGYGSVATAYGCRAWVNFNGTGTVAIRSSGNVSSITDNNVGRYTVNFTNAMPDVNYSAVCGGGYTGSVQVFFALFESSSNLAGSTAVSSYDRGTGAYVDPQIFNVAVFR